MPSSLPKMIVMALVYSSIHYVPTTAFLVSPNSLQVHRKTRPSNVVILQSSSKNNDNDDDRMNYIRQLQNNYYSSSSCHPPPEMNYDTGIMHHLPLFRVPWTELPGRSNVLNIHDPCYTDAFETILRRGSSSEGNDCRPYYFGHLLNHPQKTVTQLKSWREVPLDKNNDETWDTTEESSKNAASAAAAPMVGTLSRITDFRRLNDGRLCLLVQGLERFVIEEVVQQTPYVVAHVCIVPDYDIVTTDAAPEEEQGQKAFRRRINAMRENFAWHGFEYEDTKLLFRGKEGDYAAASDIYGSWMAKVVPFVPLGNVNLAPPLHHQQYKRTNDVSSAAKDNDDDDGVEKDSYLLELNFIKSGILQPPQTHPEISKGDMMVDAETLLWRSIEDYCRAKHKPLPKIFHQLLPQKRDYFKDISMTDVTIPEGYSRERSRVRLSYIAGALIENEMGRDLRQLWLEVPGTESRLLGLWERFELVNAGLLGEFR